MDQGPVFASNSAIGAISAVLANVSFGLGYAWAAVRFRPAFSLVVGFVVFALVMSFLSTLHLSLYPTFILTVLGLWLASKAFPKNIEDKPASKPFRAEVAVRMVASAVLVAIVTFFARTLGPHLSGMFAVFPIMASIFAYFSHRFSGAGFAVRLLNSMVRGFYGFAVFCFVVSLALPSVSIALSFFIATASALLVQVALLIWRR